MKAEWLVERLDSLDARDIRLREMAELDLSDENKRELLERSEQFQRWGADKWQPFIADLEDGDEVWRFRSPGRKGEEKGKKRGRKGEEKGSDPNGT